MTSSSTQISIPRQSGDGCVECNLIYERIADISSHKFSRSEHSFGIEFHAATQRLVKFNPVTAQL